MEDPAQKALRDYLRRDTKYHRGAGVLAMVAMVAAVVIAACFTQPWPRRGPGGGYGANYWGPFIAMGAGFVATLVVFRLMRRRTPLRPPPFDR